MVDEVVDYEQLSRALRAGVIWMHPARSTRNHQYPSHMITGVLMIASRSGCVQYLAQLGDWLVLT